mmetsp:Transcript_14313/g.42723  ORF Transcript_14313/g.42723 Transcript_14313/m.42723 type:complete len:301 (-) Transcript_14313:2088-2990(-)
MGGLRARPASGAGGPPGVPARARRRHRAHHLRGPRGRHGQVGAARRPHLGPRAARAQVGVPPPQGERRQEAGHHHLLLPARQGQRGHRRVPRRLRLHPGRGQGAQGARLRPRRRGPGRHEPRGPHGHGAQRQGSQVRLAHAQRRAPHVHGGVRAPLPLLRRPARELGPAARPPQLGRPEPPRLRRQVRQRLHRRAALLRLRGRPHAPPLLQVGLAPPRLRGLLHLFGVGLRGGRGAPLRHARLPRVHARQAGGHVRRVLPRPPRGHHSEPLLLRGQQPVRGHHRQAPLVRGHHLLPHAPG